MRRCMITVLVATAFVVLNFLIDFLYAFIDQGSDVPELPVDPPADSR